MQLFQWCPFGKWSKPRNGAPPIRDLDGLTSFDQPEQFTGSLPQLSDAHRSHVLLVAHTRRRFNAIQKGGRELRFARGTLRSQEELRHLHFIYNSQMTSKDTTTVRVRRPDSERLSALAKSRQTTVVEVVHTALDALERQEFMRGLNADYQSLDAATREDLLAEQAEWDPLV